MRRARFGSEKAGDNCCGQAACGLPALSPKLACCPPDFIIPKKDGAPPSARATLQAEAGAAANQLLAGAFGTMPAPLCKPCRHGLACMLHGMGKSCAHSLPGMATEPARCC